MSPAPHDDSVSVTLGIMRDIVTEVARRGVKVSDHLAGCLLKSVYQNPDNGFSSDRPLDRDDIRRLVGTLMLLILILYMVYIIIVTIRWGPAPRGCCMTTSPCWRPLGKTE